MQAFFGKGTQLILYSALPAKDNILFQLARFFDNGIA